MPTIAYARNQVVTQIVDGATNSITPSKLRQILLDLIDALDAETPYSKFDATAAPTADDDGANTSGNGTFAVGSLWIDVTGDEAYRCVDAATGAAVWINTTLSTSELGDLALLDTVGSSQIDDTAVINAKLANMATATLKGRQTGSTGSPEDVTMAQLVTLLDAHFGGTAWRTGGGDVAGPAASVDGEIALYDSTTGKLLKRAATTGILKAASGVLAAATDGTDFLSSSTGVKQGKHTIWLPAQAWVPRTTNGAAASSSELATNDVPIFTYDFDATTVEGIGFLLKMPKGSSVTSVTYRAEWTAASGSGGVAWGLAAVGISDGDSLDAAASGQQVVTDTMQGASIRHRTSESSAITIGGTPAEGDIVLLLLTRETGNGSDTLAVDANLIGVELFITVAAATDD